jgi:hypothetical protein
MPFVLVCNLSNSENSENKIVIHDMVNFYYDSR